MGCHRLLLIACTLGFGSLHLPAQAGNEPTWQSLNKYSEAISRQAFTACDRKADDRLDLLEALKSLSDMGSLREPKDFRKLDINRDGHLDWSEFDQHFRQTIKAGQSLKIRSSIAIAGAATQAKPKTSPAQRAGARVIEMGDFNLDGQLDGNEFSALMKKFNQPPQRKRAFPALDKDGSGTLSGSELVPMLNQVPGLIAMLAGPAPKAAPMVAPTSKLMKKADQNADQKINEPELVQVLRSLHPRLGRWSSQILRAADRNGNASLEQGELEAAGH